MSNKTTQDLTGKKLSRSEMKEVSGGSGSCVPECVEYWERQGPGNWPAPNIREYCYWVCETEQPY